MSDEDHVRETVSAYLDGMMYADEPKLRRAFHPDAKSIGHEGSLLEWDSLDTFIAACLAAGGLEANEGYDAEVLSVDVTGDMAAVKLEDLYRGMRYTDYLTLMKIDGRWQIINKAFVNHSLSA